MKKRTLNRLTHKQKVTITFIAVLAVLIVATVVVLICLKGTDGTQAQTEKQTQSITEKQTIADIEIPDVTVETETSKTTETVKETSKDTSLPTSNYTKYQTGEEIPLNMKWKYADMSAINSGSAVYYKATSNIKGVAVAVNAGHGTSGGESQKTYCHPDKTPKVTGGSTAEGATMATAVAGGMTFNDGTKESTATLNMARILRDKLLAAGYDVVMLRDGENVQLDNVARTVIANNAASCHISIHWDGDGTSSDKGAFYIGVPDGIKNLETVSAVWQKSENLGQKIINSLSGGGYKLYNNGRMEIDLTQTSYSTIPSVDLELGNQCSDIGNENLSKMADLITAGVCEFLG